MLQKSTILKRVAGTIQLGFEPPGYVPPCLVQKIVSQTDSVPDNRAVSPSQRTEEKGLGARSRDCWSELGLIAEMVWKTPNNFKDVSM
jgi:hypothetical protein